MEKNNMTAVEWLVNQILLKHTEIVQFLPNWSFDKSIIEQAKQMEEDQKYETSAFWFGRGVLAGKENRIEELKPNK